MRHTSGKHPPGKRALRATVAAGLVLAAATSRGAAPAARGLIGRWSFNRFDDLRTPDGSRNGNQASVNNVTRVKGVDGSALSFGIKPGWVTCPDVPAVTDGVTVEAWFNPAGARPPAFGTVARKEGAYALRFGDAGRIGFLVWIGGTPRYVHSTRDSWEPGTWYHLAGTYDGQHLRVFIDGREAEGSPSEQTGEISDGGALCGIGSCRGRYPLRGTVDEVGIHDRALSDAEIAQSYQAGLRALDAQKERKVEPLHLGEATPAFRKPLREVRMVVPGFLWLDAEDFADYGGWILDTQFVHLMGSGYLLATGVGKPVEDAGTTVDVPRAGVYRAWVRTRNWVREHAPGKFELVVNGKSLGKVLGAADSDDWVWESAGDVPLEAGKATLALHDLTGYYGRCDVIVLTTDRAYDPPGDRESVCRERARLTGLSLAPAHAGDFDVIVVGGGSAGCPAAIAAARMGAKTALIQNRPVLGGNSSRECGVGLNGAASHHPNSRETGIAEEVHRTKAYYGSRAYSEPFRIVTEKEENLTVFLNRHVFDVEMADAKRIAAVRAVDTLTGAISALGAKYFIDCTGDGWVGYFAKAEYRLGREARSEHDESNAPEKADRITMSGCLMGGALGFRALSTGQPTPYERPVWAYDIPKLDGYGRKVRRITGGEWWLEHPGTVDDLWEAEKARDELIRITFGYWDYIKHKSDLREQARTYALVHVPHMDAKRESRRLIGDYILTQDDCTSGRVFPDRISYGGWPLDIHHPKGVFSGSEGSFDYNTHVPIYTIPYRCLYSKNIDNLLFAGRCASVTHVALGTIRVQSTLATLGQAAGTAAGLCVRRGTTPRGIHRNYLGTLQQTLLKHDQTIPELVNEDPLDLARGATVRASSTAEFRHFAPTNVRKADQHALDHDRAMLFPAAPGVLRTVRACLVSRNPQPTPLTLHLRTAADAEGASISDDLTTATASVPANTESWVAFDVGVEVSSPFLWIALPKTEGLSWRMMSGAVPGCARAYGSLAGNTWTLRKGEFYAFTTDPHLRVATTYRTGNVVNGKIRAGDGESNAWASDGRQDFPQWIEIDFGRPTPVNSVYLTFDTNPGPRIPTAARPPECVRDYAVACHVDGAWRTVSETKGNWMRRRIHRFDPVDATRIRVTVHATNGESSARIFEVRAYNE